VIHVADKVMGGSFTQEEMNWLINLTNHIAVGMQNAQLYESIKVISDGVLKTLTKIIELKDFYTSGHSERVALFALLIGEKLGLSNTELDILRYGGWLHDIGKIGVPEAILSKPDKLTNEEYDIIRKHPITGKEILQTINPLNDILPVVLHHHEWYNGNGYPDGLKGNQIPVSARILHIADAIDAMTSNRAYRKALEIPGVVDQLKIFSGVQFDPDIVKVVLDTMLFDFFEIKSY
jgi:putative nucleotidyltransferase with HDIG domain